MPKTGFSYQSSVIWLIVLFCICASTCVSVCYQFL